jgi:hypothetical protein
MAARPRAKPRRASPGSRGAPGSSTPTPPSTGATDSTATERDPRRWIYAGLDVVFAAIYAIAIAKVIPNRLPSATIHLWTFPVASGAMAVGMLTGQRTGWWIAVIGGTLSLGSMVLLIVRIAISAAFLAGVYGAFGKAAATFALVMVALVIELVALLPIVQVKYLMTRAGRRAFEMPPRGQG